MGPPTPTGGFTLIEIMMALVLFAIAAGIGFLGMSGFNEATVADRAAKAITSDVTLTRSYAIQRQGPVSLAADEANRSYAIRDESTGDTLKVRSYAADTDLPLTRLDVQTADDALTFNARGLIQGGASVTILVERLDSGQQIEVTPLGRTKVTSAP